MSSNLERMQKLFPNCPICGNSTGYKSSICYPMIQCISCEAEWVLSEDEMELKKTSRMGWDFELLNNKMPISFWKDWKGPQITEKKFAPMDYTGGHTDYKDPAIGYIALTPDNITYKTTEASLHRMEIRIPIAQFKGIQMRTGKEITFLRWFLIGAWSILFKKKNEYLVLTYEDIFGMEQHMIFDFHSQRKNADELIGLLSYLKKKKAGMKSLT